MENSSVIYAGVISELFGIHQFSSADVAATLHSVGITTVDNDGHVTAVADETQQLTIEKILTVSAMLAVSPVATVSGLRRHSSPQFWASLMIQAAGTVWLANPNVRHEFYGDGSNPVIGDPLSFEPTDDFDEDDDSSESFNDIVVSTLLQVSEGTIFNWDHVISVRAQADTFTVETAQGLCTCKFDKDYVVDAKHLSTLMIEAKIATARLLGG